MDSNEDIIPRRIQTESSALMYFFDFGIVWGRKEQNAIKDNSGKNTATNF